MRLTPRRGLLPEIAEVSSNTKEHKAIGKGPLELYKKVSSTFFHCQKSKTYKYSKGLVVFGKDPRT